MTIWFSNGTFNKINTDPNQRFSPEFLQCFSIDKVNAIELNCYNEAMVDYILGLPTFDVSGFLFVSFHTPAIHYDDNEETHRVLKKLRILHKRIGIKNFIFHADTIYDWNTLYAYRDLPISIENMDNNKSFGRSVADIKSILDRYDFGLTLDLQHCFVNDNSMQLALDFQKEFKDKIVEYHISGFEANILHYPLFNLQQDIIIDSLRYKNIPIIIESCFDEIGDQKKELAYIQNKIND